MLGEAVMEPRNHRHLTAAAIVVLVLAAAFPVPGLVSSASAQQLDCDDVDHECVADAAVALGIKQAGRAMLACMRDRAGACDLDASLASVPSAECRQGIECELAELRDLVSDGDTGCAERLCRDAYRFMARQEARSPRGHRDRITDDLARMKAQAS